MGGITRTIGNAVRAAAFLAEEIEENAISSVVRDAFLVQFNELAVDMKALVDDAKTKIDEHAKLRKEETDQPPTPLSSRDANMEPRPPQGRRSYADTLINPPSHADPKLAAREGIRARQIMLEGIDQNSPIGKMDSSQLKVELNKILREAGWKGKGIRSAIIQKNKGVLIKLETDEAFRWINKQENKFSFSVEVGPDVVFKPRSHTIIAFNVPLTIDPENGSHRKEICDANHLEEEAIGSIRWVKPVARRTPEQKSAHLFISFTDPSSANRALSNGISICNKKIRTEKVKKEPTRCLKCQGWNHFAYECDSLSDKCSNCAGNHRTSQCPDPCRQRCVSCSTDDHASWSRICPVYLRKVTDCNSRNPENLLHFFPTSEPWTWTTSANNKSNRAPQHDIYRPAHEHERRWIREKTLGPRITDSYRPSREHYTHSVPPDADPYRQGPTLAKAGRWTTTGSTPPLDTELPPSCSWDDDTPHDNIHLFQQKPPSSSLQPASEAVSPPSANV